MMMGEKSLIMQQVLTQLHPAMMLELKKIFLQWLMSSMAYGASKGKRPIGLLAFKI